MLPSEYCVICKKYSIYYRLEREVHLPGAWKHIVKPNIRPSPLFTKYFDRSPMIAGKDFP